MAKKTKITKNELFVIVSALFVGCLLIANVLASKTFAIGSIVLPCAVILFPIVYITNDVLAEVFGFTKARRVIITGFAINVLAVIAYQVAILLPSPVFAVEAGDAFAAVLGSTPRILLGSLAAYLVGSLLNAKVMQKLKDRFPKLLMFRCIFSTIVGEGLDALIFISIAFYGTMPLTALITMIISQATFKVVYEIICYPATKLVINKCKQAQ